MQLQNHSSALFHKNESLVSGTSNLSCSPMAYNTTASLGKIKCINYVDYGKIQARFGQFFRSEIDSYYLDAKLKIFKKDDNKEIQLVQNLTMGEADFNQFMRLRNQLVNTVGIFHKEENLSPVLIPTISKDMNEQLKLALKLVDIGDRTNKKFCVTLLRYIADKPAIFHAQVRIIAGKNQDEKF